MAAFPFFQEMHAGGERAMKRPLIVLGFVGLELIRDVDPHRFTNVILDVVFGETAWLYG